MWFAAGIAWSIKEDEEKKEGVTPPRMLWIG